MISILIASLCGQLTIYDEGTRQAGRATEVNCSGSGVTCTMSGLRWTLAVSTGLLPDGGAVGGVTTVTASSPLASSGGTAPNISLTGTVSQARGGTGAGALTCTSGQCLTSNGSAYSCTSTITANDLTCSSCVALGSEVSGTLPQANGGTGAGALTCTNTERLTSNGTAYSCSALVGGACSAGQAITYASGSSFTCTSALAGGNPTEVQYNNATALGGIANFTSNGVVVILGNDAGTVSAPTDGLALYGKRFVDWSEIMSIGPGGGEAALQESAFDVPWVLMKPSGTNSLSCFGTGCSAGTSTTTGTITQPAQTFPGDDWEWRFRTQLQTAASTNATAAAYGTGNSNNLGAFNTTKGFKFWAQFSAPRVNANARLFVGLRDPVTTMMPNTDPSAYLQAAGCTLDSAQTTLRLTSSSPDAGALSTDCGASFTVRDGGTAFTCRIFVPPGGAYVDLMLTNEYTGAVCLVHRTTTVPSTNYPLETMLGTNSGATGAATNIETTGIYARAASR